MKLHNFHVLLVTVLFLFFSKVSTAQIVDIGDVLNLNSLNYGLVGYYPFTGNAGDSSGTGNHGTTKNGVSLTTDRFGNSNSAYLFDGSNDYIEIADHNSLDLTDSFSITLWLNQYSAASGGYRLFDKTTAGINDGYNFDTYGGGGGRKLRLTGGNANVEANATFNLNSWNQVLVIHYKDTTWLYQNSTLISKGEQKNILANSLKARIGANQNTGNCFDGKIDEVRVYNRALCPLEVKIVYGLTLRLGAKVAKTNFCSSGSTNILLSNPQPYVQYRLLKASDSSVVGTMKSSACSDTLYFPTGTINQTTSYLFSAFDPATNTSKYLDTVITVNVWAPYSDTIDTVVCGNNGVFFNGQTRYAIGTYIGNFKNKFGCDSIITLVLSKNGYESYPVNASVCSNDSIFLQKAYRKTAGAYWDTTARAGQCDSVTITTLSILPLESANSTLNICTGDSIFLQKAYRKTAGTYRDTIKRIGKCDSVAVITLGLLPLESANRTLTICNGDSVFLQKAYRKIAGSYRDTTKRTGKCDSVTITTLSLNNLISAYQAISICINDSVLVNGKYLKTSGLYYDTLTSLGGCDSILTTEITYKSIDYGSRTAYICSNDSIKISSRFYKTPGTYYDTILVANCVDSVITVTLNIVNAEYDSADVHLCNGDSVLINGKSIFNSGIYYDSLQNKNGCDSIVKYNVITHSVDPYIFTFSFCFQDSIFFDGSFYRKDTIFYDTLVTSYGCDSIVMTVLDAGGVLPAMRDTSLFCEDVRAEFDAGVYDSYLWNNGETQRYLSTNIEGVYWVNLVDSFNCKYTDTAIALEKCSPQVFVPTSFTPNGDGKNDFFVFNAYNVDQISFRVFNRWGEEVFSTKDKNIVWDGKYKNEALPIGLYFWIVNYRGKNLNGISEIKNQTGLLYIIN